MKGKVCERKVDTPDEMLARILDAAVARVNRRDDQIRRKNKGYAKWTEVGGGTFEHLLWTDK